MINKHILVCSVLMFFVFKPSLAENFDNDDRIRPCRQNPFYWEYKGSPVLLIGGSQEDNLFNHPDDLEEQLDLLRASGGNYIRNTMSSRDPGNPWAFKRLETGLYDLNQWDKDYWNRFQNLLELCVERDIIVQIEIWDPWDYFKTEASLGYGPDNVGWESCPFNPRLNTNYTAQESGLVEDINYHSGRRPSKHSFFHTVPEMKDIPIVRQYQEAFVDKILSISLSFPNVLYCMNNEIGEWAQWGQYWARYIRNKAAQAGKEVYLTDMRRNSNFSSDEQVSLLHDREHFDFFEISQNNARDGQQHYDGVIFIRNQISKSPIPLNNIKIYGGEIGKWTTSVKEGTHRFWRNIFAGCASARFHRPGPSHHFFGIGISELAQANIRSMSMLVKAINIFKTEPRNELLSDREENESYCLAQTGSEYAVYFPDGGSVALDISHVKGSLSKKWLDIEKNKWLEPEIVSGGGKLELKTPAKGQWAVVLIADTKLCPEDEQELPIAVILDTDIGDDIDDVWAIVLLLVSEEFDIKMITSATGDTRARAKTIAKILERLGRNDIPIGIGKKTQSKHNYLSRWVEDYNLENYKGRIYEDGADAMASIITESEKPITIITIGPLTNIAESINSEPDITKNAHLVGMLGSIYTGYAHHPKGKPSAEWNVVQDIDAAKTVFNSAIPMTITPLDTCGTIRLEGDKYQKIVNSENHAAKLIIETYGEWLNRRFGRGNNRRQWVNSKSTVLYDTAAVYLAMKTDLLKMENLKVSVNNDGYTVIDDNAKEIEVATKWKDLEAFEDFLLSRLTY
jgi:inosine-uridine nucleoside N-ribohydrolase